MEGKGANEDEDQGFIGMTANTENILEVRIWRTDARDQDHWRQSLKEVMDQQSL